MSPPSSRSIDWNSGGPDRGERERLLGQHGCVIWFTGLSGSGKSTLCNAVEQALHDRGIATYKLDGDNLRHGLNADLAFSPVDRAENIRRIGEVAGLFADAGLVVLAACISPYAEGRAAARKVATRVAGEGRFVEVYLRATVAQCEARDPKGLYRAARRGELEDFTGISAPFEVPESPDCDIDTDSLDPSASLDRIIAHLEERGLLPALES